MKGNILVKLGDALSKHPKITKAAMLAFVAAMAFDAMKVSETIGKLEGYSAARNDLEEILNRVSDDDEDSDDAE